MKAFIVGVLILLISVVGVSGQQTFTGFQYGSVAGSYVGQGTNYSGFGQFVPYGQTNGGLTVSRPVYISPGNTYFTFFVEYPNNWWSLSVESPDSSGIKVGTFEAQRFSNWGADVGGFSFTGNGRGYNWSYSTVDILEVGYTADGYLSKLAFNFVQRGGTYPEIPAGAITEFGEFRFNSSIGFSAIPEPSTYAAIVGLAGLVIAFIAKRRRVSKLSHAA